VAGELPGGLRPAASTIFGADLALAERYAHLLATDGITRGLLGPREADRLWDRHLLNSAVLSEVVPSGVALVDVGSGAGLPGIPLALGRPDLRVVLLEPMLRRVTFLEETVNDLGLSSRVFVVRGRAPESVSDLPFRPDYAVARAVAPLDRLVSWTMPLVRPAGALLALRGRSAEDEVRTTRAAVARTAGSEATVLSVGAAVLDEPATVVRVVNAARTNGKEPGDDGGRRSDRTRNGPQRRRRST
jgi:16S rRNA (guanine527-N7)-methyltransferase